MSVPHPHFRVFSFQKLRTFIRGLRCDVIEYSWRWRYWKDHFRQGMPNAFILRPVDRVLIYATSQRHLTGEFEKKYIGMCISRVVDRDIPRAVH